MTTTPTPGHDPASMLELGRVAEWIRSRACNHCRTGDLHECRNPAASLEWLANADVIDGVARTLGRPREPGNITDLPAIEQVSAIEQIDDTADRLRTASIAQELYALLVRRMARLRSGAMSDLVSEGWTYQAVADLTGITRARVEQLVKRHRSEGDP